MGGGSYSVSSFRDYSKSSGYTYDTTTHRVSGHTYKSTSISKALNAKGKVRECCNSAEHPNTVPVILALDVTGSMGSACDECASSISALMKDLYEQFKDVEVCVMGVGDFECDDAPLQVSQFESDVRVAKQMDEVWLEKGGGGNGYESYTAPWWFGLYRTSLDCYDKQGRKGIIITMGDEPLNPELHRSEVEDFLGERSDRDKDGHPEYIFETNALYKAASKKFDIYHITVADDRTNYDGNGNYERNVDKSFKDVIGESNYIVSSVDSLKNNIVKLIERSYKEREHLVESNNDDAEKKNDVKTDESGAIVW
jgi:hypothetical protein